MRYHKGGILIEFAFSIPILISLLFFINDHYRFHELKDKVKSSAYLAASMIQQITNTRTNKQLTIDDLGRIAFVSCLNFFHTNSMFKPCPFGIRPSIRTYYVKRINKNEYQLQICYANTAVTDNTSAPLQMDKNCGKLTTQTLSQIQELHPDLSSDKNGDERVLIIYFYYPFYFDKSKLGLFLLYPKPAYLS